MNEIVPVSSDEDIARVVTVAWVVWPQHYEPIIGSDQVAYMLEKFQSVAAIRAQIEEGTRYYLVISNGEDAGYLSFDRGPDELFLSKVYVLDNFQGRGLGKLALQFVREQAGNSAITLTVNKHNAGSIAFYERLGFEKIESIVKDIGGGFVMDDYVMKQAARS